jgi:hypothetical protein
MRTTTPCTGIGVQDLAWIHRDQFLHYLSVARATNDPADWPRFRGAVVDALEVALGLAPHETGPDGAGSVVQDARRAHDPSDDWEPFIEMLWLQRGRVRHDLA